MKKLLATTAMYLVLGTGLNAFADSNESRLARVNDVHQFTEISSQKNILAIATNMYRGDFQKIARSAVFTNLYSGEGSALMGSIRMLRD